MRRSPAKNMPESEVVAALCEICEIQNDVIRRLSEAIEQMDATVAVDVQAAQERYNAPMGRRES